LLTDKVKACNHYKYYLQAIEEEKVGFLDEAALPAYMKKGKKGSKSGSSESSTKTKPKKKPSSKVRIPTKKPTAEPGWFPSPPASPKKSDSERTESDEGPQYREAFAQPEEDENVEDIDWDKNIDEFADNAVYPPHLNQKPFTEAQRLLEEERLRREKMKKPATVAQESEGLSVEEENERALNLGLLHSRIDDFNANQPPPPEFTQTTTEAGTSSSIPESTTGIHTEMVTYDNPSVSPTDFDMTMGEDVEGDPMDTDAPRLMSVEEMESRERAQEEELKRKQEAEEARLEELAQAKLEETIRMEESRKAEEAAKLAEEQLKKAEEARLAEELRLKAEAA
ncbi:MAG: hypothetical protein J6586_12695, partial [Snodgrassella sp.]|nr:hypothetical protein [Snodgrassella sp.]